MTDAHIISFIREEIRRQVQIILSGKAGQNEVDREDIDEMIPGMPTITDRPVMHPYGFASRAARGTQNIVARQGDHASSRIVIGHRDQNRPSNLEEGESSVYSVGDFRVICRLDRVSVSKGDSLEETMVLGDKLTTMLKNLLDAIISHTHPSPGAPPTNTVTFQSIKDNQVSGDKLLAKDGGGF